MPNALLVYTQNGRRLSAQCITCRPHSFRTSWQSCMAAYTAEGSSGTNSEALVQTRKLWDKIGSSGTNSEALVQAHQAAPPTLLRRAIQQGFWRWWRFETVLKGLFVVVEEGMVSSDSDGFFLSAVGGEVHERRVRAER